MKIAVFGKEFGDANIDFIRIFFNKLKKVGIRPMVFKEFHEFLTSKQIDVHDPMFFKTHIDLAGNADCLFSIGGDGTFLNTLGLVRDSEIPVVGINTGRLGFLSSIPKEEVESAVDEILNGNYTIDKRSLLKLDASEEDLFGNISYALNELTIHKQDSSSMIITHVFLNDEFLNSYWSDGLIISTPTGSTAYSLSCGGPIMTPASGNFIINPVSPHNLNVRPVVIPDDTIITVKVEGRHERFLVSLDSRSETIESSVELKIRKEDFKLSLIRLNNQDFLTTLRNKLMWGLDKRN
jgi:NAD+ kinase